MDYQVKSKVARCQSEFLTIHQGKDFAKFFVASRRRRRLENRPPGLSSGVRWLRLLR